jgi:hypothetical protein
VAGVKFIDENGGGPGVRYKNGTRRRVERRLFAQPNDRLPTACIWSGSDIIEDARSITVIAVGNRREIAVAGGAG